MLVQNCSISVLSHYQAVFLGSCKVRFQQDAWFDFEARGSL